MTPNSGQTHRGDFVSLTTGLAFLALAVWWLLEQTDSNVHSGWIAAGALLVLGAASFGIGVAPRRRSKPSSEAVYPEAQARNIIVE